MMRAYAAIAGAEVRAAEEGGRDFDIRQAMTSLVLIARPELSREQAAVIVAREISRCATKSDVEPVLEYVRAKNKSLNEDALPALAENIGGVFQSADKGLLVRMVIANEVERRYGEMQRSEYLYEVVTGAAK